jgi:hypothetical protein
VVDDGVIFGSEFEQHGVRVQGTGCRVQRGVRRSAIGVRETAQSWSSELGHYIFWGIGVFVRLPFLCW